MSARARAARPRSAWARRRARPAPAIRRESPPTRRGPTAAARRRRAAPARPRPRTGRGVGSCHAPLMCTTAQECACRVRTTQRFSSRLHSCGVARPARREAPPRAGARSRSRSIRSGAALREVGDRLAAARPLAERRGVPEAVAEVPRDGVPDRRRRAPRQPDRRRRAPAPAPRPPARAGPGSSVGGWSRSTADASGCETSPEPLVDAHRAHQAATGAAAVRRSSAKAPWGRARPPRAAGRHRDDLVGGPAGAETCRCPGAIGAKPAS